MHALRVNAARVQTSLMIKTLPSLEYKYFRKTAKAGALQQPTYASRFPHAQRLAMAVGQLLFAHPRFGVWLCGRPIDDSGVAPVCGRASRQKSVEREC